MGFFTKDKDRDNDFDKIKVTSNGAFYMDSEDIFDDKEKSLALIKKLRDAMEAYKKANVTTAESSHSSKK